MQSLGSLDPSFAMMGEMAGFDATIQQRYPEVEAVNHVHTAGNSSGIVDGSAGILMGTKEMGEKYGMKARAKIKGFASIGSEPSIMLTGPGDVTDKLLKNLGMNKNDIDLWELNEAFASVVLRYMDHIGIDHSNINVNGGAFQTKVIHPYLSNGRSRHSSNHRNHCANQEEQWRPARGPSIAHSHSGRSQSEGRREARSPR
jgi:acetyl-CoA C-acetyltransferase